MQSNFRYLAFICVMSFLLSNCSHPDVSNTPVLSQKVKIYPDYTDIALPPNIAPLNFRIDSDGEHFFVDFIGENGYTFSISSNKKIIIPTRKWKKLLSENIGKSYQIQIYRKQQGQWEKFPPIINSISTDSIDPYLTYRLIPPGYEFSSYLTIQQRHLESFDCSDIANSSMFEGSCMNCHLTNGGNPDEFMIHFRFQNSGTVIYKDGKFRRLNTTTSDFSNPGTYPSWHPSGRFIAFATNTAELYFHADVAKRSEVYDSKSNLAILDLETNTMLAYPKLSVPDPVQESFPCWSPDGKYLYFCRCDFSSRMDTLSVEQKLASTHYNLYRVPFDEKNIQFGDIELIVDAQKLNQTTALPRISPDGKFLLFCIAHRGTFTAWKKESDLYLFDLQTFNIRPLTNANSEDSDSYHAWSSNSKWFVVSSKRRDGFVALPYFSHIDTNGNETKAFLLPQKDPNFYDTWTKSFNIPELVKGKIKNIHNVKNTNQHSTDVGIKWIYDSTYTSSL